MEEQLKRLMQELGDAINESLAESDRIAAAIGEIKQAGYEVFLVLEATIGFNKRDEAGDEDQSASEAPARSESSPKNTRRVKWTLQDQ